MLTLVCYVLHLMLIGLKELQIKNYTITFQKLQKQYAIVGYNFQDTYRDMVEKLCTICFFGCQKMENSKEEGHRKHILTLIEDTWLHMEEFRTFMANRQEWRSFINSNCPRRFDQRMSEWKKYPCNWTDNMNSREIIKIYKEGTQDS